MNACACTMVDVWSDDELEELPPANKRKAKSKGKESCKPTKQKMLNKKEKTQVMEYVEQLSLSTLKEHDVGSQRSGPDLNIFNNLLRNHQPLQTILKFHKTTFVQIYFIHSKGKEKYLQFHLEWHRHCSIFLVPKELSLDCVLTSASRDILNAREVWQSFVQSTSTTSDGAADFNKLMILISSSLYERMLCIHSRLTSLSLVRKE